MNVLRRLAKRRRTASGSQYVCGLCGATFDDEGVVICPKCRGFVTKREP